MRAILRLPALVPVLACLLAPAAAHAQRTTRIPPLHIAPLVEVDTTAPRDTLGLRLRLSEGTGRAEPRATPAPSTMLAQADAARILQRLRPLTELAAQRDSFAFPARTLPAPR
ncbi:MAG TPA: hypothetical protein VNP72_08340, partial [Longimicrobium sp.]|nr:hypothetical protein [Longimicrobium sp.]